MYAAMPPFVRELPFWLFLGKVDDQTLRDMDEHKHDEIHEGAGQGASPGKQCGHQSEVSHEDVKGVSSGTKEIEESYIEKAQHGGAKKSQKSCLKKSHQYEAKMVQRGCAKKDMQEVGNRVKQAGAELCQGKHSLS